MNLARFQINNVNKSLILFIAILLTTACGKFNSESEQSSSETANISDNVVDASQISLIPQKSVHKIAGVNYQKNSIATSNAFNATGAFTYPLPSKEFSGNISVSMELADEDGIKQVFIGFVGSDLTLPICELNCGTQFSAFVNGINPTLFGLKAGELTITLLVEDTDGNLSQVNSLNLNWRELLISGVSASLNPDTEELTISWNTLTGALRYNVYLSNDANLTGQNYVDLAGGDAKLSLTGTSAVFTQKTVNADYYILVTGVDGSGESAFSDKVILINGNKSALPIAIADNFTVDEDQILSGNLLLNDSGEGDVIIANTEAVSPPSNGSVIINTNGDFTYTPNINFNGSDQFSYSIVNTQGLTGSNNVTITVSAINDLPSAFDDTFVIESDTLLINSPGLLTNDTDIDGNQLTVITELLQQPKFGVVTINSDGSFEYKKETTFTTYDNFIYAISDGTDASQSAIVTITTPEFNGYPPVAKNDAFETNEDTQLIVTLENSILNNDFDEDDDTKDLILSISKEPINGDLVIDAGGTFTYLPKSNYFGVDEFNYSLTDAKGNEATATVSIEVLAQNDAPTALNDNYIVQANNPNEIPLVFGLLNNDSDIDNDTIKVVQESVSQPSSGSVVIEENGSFTYTPNAGFIGTDSFNYKISDGTLNSVDASVQLFVSEVIATTNDLTPITISMAELTNGFNKKYEIKEISALHGQITVDGDVITYSPALGFGGIDTITVIYLIDGQEYLVSFYVHVDLTNVAPVINSLAPILAQQNTLYSYAPVVTDPDNSAEELTWTLSNAPNGMEMSDAGIITWIPDSDVSTSGLINLSISDLEFTTIQEFEITVTAQDTDNDGQPNDVDTDDDNDGILDSQDAHPLVAEFSDGDTNLGFSVNGMISNGMLDNVQSFAIHPNGRYAYIGSSNGLMIADLNEDGSLTGTYNQLTTTELGSSNYTQGNYVKISSNGNLYWVSSIDWNGEVTQGMRVFDIDQTTGLAKLTQTMPISLKNGVDTNQSEIFEFSPNGKFLYTTVHYGTAGNYLLIYSVDQVDGHLSYAGEFDLNSFGYPDYESNLTISFDGQYIYYAYEDSKIAILKADTTTGLIVSSISQSFADGIYNDIAIKSSTSTNHLYFAHRGDVKVMAIDNMDGSLTESTSLTYDSDLEGSIVISLNSDETQLAIVDKKSNYLVSYFTIDEQKNISLNGQFSIDYITLDLRFNSKNNYIYWSNWGIESSLYSTLLGGDIVINEHPFGNQGANFSSNAIPSQFSLLALTDDQLFTEIKDYGHGYLELIPYWPTTTESLTSFLRASLIINDNTVMLIGDKRLDVDGVYNQDSNAGTEIVFNRLLTDGSIESKRFDLKSDSNPYTIVRAKTLGDNRILTMERSENHFTDDNSYVTYGATIYKVEDDLSLTQEATVFTNGYLNILNIDTVLNGDELTLDKTVYQIVNGEGVYLREDDISPSHSDEFWSEDIAVHLYTDSKSVSSFVSRSSIPAFTITANDHEYFVKLDDKRFALISNSNAGFISIEVYQVTSNGDFIPLAHSNLATLTQSIASLKLNYDSTTYTLWLSLNSGYDETFKLTFGSVVDSDNDGFFDHNDMFPLDSSEWSDYDRDGIGDNSDLDIDNDGVENDLDAFPYDFTETTDTDSDGVGNYKDAFPNDNTKSLDSDLDGIDDTTDAFPFDSTESVDTDFDGVGDNSDFAPNDNTEQHDSDLDGVGDNTDAYPFDNSQSEFIELNSHVEVTDYSVTSAYLDSDSAWFAQSEYYTQGGTAIRSGDIEVNQTSTVQTIVNIDSNGMSLTFDWKVSNDTAQLSLVIDSQYMMSISGEQDWQTQYIELTPGDHVIEWRYSKYDVNSSGLDAGFIDNVKIEPIVTLADLSFTDYDIQTCIESQYTIDTNINYISSLNCYGSIGDLTDLTQLTSLQYLNLFDAIVADWSALADLNLTSFSLYNTSNFSDWSLLDNHSQLTHLTLYNIDYSDWDFLSGFNLTSINLDDSNFSDTADISHMTNLETLSLHRTEISNWEGLNGLNIVSLWAIDSTLDSLSYFNTSTLLNLEASNTEITNFDLLPQFAFENLSIGNTNFSNLSLLTNSLTTLRHLKIEFTNTVDFTLLENMPNLNALGANITGSSIAQNQILFNLNNNGVYIYSAEDSDNNGVFDFLEDQDWDGQLNDSDPDNDNDGVNDELDAYPSDPLKSELDDLAVDAEYTESTLSSGFTVTDSAWFSQNEYFTTGSSALRSGNINNQQQSIVQTTITVTEHGSALSFDWKVSSESCCNYLSLYVDGIKQNAISGEIDWQQQTINLTSGTHLIEWIYSKDGGADDGLDAGFIDNIQLTALTNTAPVFLTSGVTEAIETESYYYYVQVEDYSPNLTWTIDGPDDMQIDNSGMLSWTPPYNGVTQVSVTITVSDGEYTTEQTFNIDISPSQNPLLSSLSWNDSDIELCVFDLYSANDRVNDIYYLSCQGTFDNLTDLQQLLNLQSINFSDSDVSDWSALADLDLIDFSLHGNTNFSEANFSLLQGHENLTSMTLYNTNFNSWDFLSNFDLTYINLDESNFSELSKIDHMINLDTLLLSSTPVSDWSLINIFDLGHLSISNTTFDNLSLLSNMSSLYGLSANYVSVENGDWSTLSSFINLSFLYLNGGNISVLPSLDNMLSLNSLELGDTQITDFSPLTNLQLYYFSAYNTSFSNLNDLSGSFEYLNQININSTNVTDLSPLNSFTNLMYLQANINALGSTQNTILLGLYENAVTIFDAPDENDNGVFDFYEDFDGDGYLNDIDDDDDGDGVLDINDAYPNEADAYLLIDLVNAVDFTGSVVTSAGTSGVSRWLEQSDEFTTGTTALKSGYVKSNNYSILTADIDAGDDGATVTFDLKIISEAGYGVLTVFVDENPVFADYEQHDWTASGLNLSPGTHTIKWQYQNWIGDSSAAYIDNMNVEYLVVNDSPIITSTAPTSATEDTLYTYTPTVLDNDDSNDGSDLTWILDNEPTGMVISSTGEVTWTPVEGEYTSGIVTITVTDGGEDSSIASSEDFTITVLAVNDPPNITSTNTITLDENSKSGVLVYTSVVDDPDIGQSHTFSLYDPSGALAIDSANGLVYVVEESSLDFETNSTFNFDITVEDEGSYTDTISVTLTLNDVVENTEYALVSSFAANGIAHFNTYADTNNDDYLIHAVGDALGNRYMLVQSQSDYIYRVGKITNDGKFDLTFGLNGRKHLNPDLLNDENVSAFDDGAYSNFTPQKIKLDESNNHIYILGHQQISSNTIQPFVIRLTATGNIDNSFSSDGKYEIPNSDLNEGDDSTAVDIVIHSNTTSLHLASTSLASSSNTKQSKITELSTSGIKLDHQQYDLLDIGGYDETIVGLVENSIGNLVALGYSDNSGDLNVLAAELNLSDLSSSTNNGVGVEFDVGTLSELSISSDVISSYAQIDGTSLILGGSTDLSGYVDSLVLKLNINTISLDPTFGTGLGYFLASVGGTFNEEIISLALDSNNNISFITKVEDSGKYRLILNQLDETGTVPNASLLDSELTNTSDLGLSSSNANAIVIHDLSDSDNTINILSMFEKTNYNQNIFSEVLSPEIFNTEVEIYYETVDINLIPADFGEDFNRIDYEFSPTNTNKTFTNLIHSSDVILSISERDNTQGGYQGVSLFSHNLLTGELNQEFGESQYPGVIQTDADDTSYIFPEAVPLIELNDGKILSAEVIVYDLDEFTYSYHLKVSKYNVNGEMESGFPLVTQLSDYTSITGIAFNQIANKVALFGGYGIEAKQSLIVTIDPDTGSSNEELFPELLGLDMNSDANTNELVSGVIQDDGSIIALGQGGVGDYGYIDTFIIKVTAEDNGLLVNNFDSVEGDDVLVIEIATYEDIRAGKMVQLSDGSIIYSANHDYGDAGYVVKIDNTDESGNLADQQFAIVTGFGEGFAGAESGEDFIQVDLILFAENGTTPYSEINDLTLDENDNVIAVGYVDFNSSEAGFIMKFNGLTGEPDSTFGNKVSPGYFIPNGRNDCENQSYTDYELSLCDITNYSGVSLTEDGSIIINAHEYSPINTYDSIILKFELIQQDEGTYYQMPSGFGED